MLWSFISHQCIPKIKVITGIPIRFAKTYTWRMFSSVLERNTYWLSLTCNPILHKWSRSCKDYLLLTKNESVPASSYLHKVFYFVSYHKIYTENFGNVLFYLVVVARMPFQFCFHIHCSWRHFSNVY